MDDREECIDELEDGVVEITHVELKRQKRIKRNEDPLRDSGITLSTPVFAF